MIEVIRAKLLLILAATALHDDKTVYNSILKLIEYIDINQENP